MEIKVRKFNSHYFPSDSGADSVINIASAGYTYGSPDFYVDLSNSSFSPSLGVYELEYITEGVFYIESGGKTYTANKGDFVLINKGVPRVLYTDKKNPVKKYLLNLKGALADGLMKVYGINDAILIMNFDAQEYFLKILGILGAAESYTVETEGEIAAELVKLLHAIYTAEQKAEALKIIPDCSAEDILKYIDMNIGRRFSIEEMCDHFYIGRTKLWRIFKQKYNTTPLEYLQAKRIEKAKYYLLNTRHPISTLHEIVGLSDQKYFSKLFKKETGMTPRKFRDSFFGMENVTAYVLANTEKELLKRKTDDALIKKY